jgi:hypothetical protein
MFIFIKFGSVVSMEYKNKSIFIGKRHLRRSDTNTTGFKLDLNDANIQG